MKIKLFILTTLIAWSAFGQGQREQQEAMQRLSVLAGQWRGAGWIRQGEVSHSFTQSEEVMYKLNGTALLIEGKGYENDSLVFEALAVASFDVGNSKYIFNAYVNDGRHTPAKGWFDDTGIFHWSFIVPNGGTVRYSIHADGTSWHETGAFSPPNSEEWYPFMEMNLKKTN